MRYLATAVVTVLLVLFAAPAHAVEVKAADWTMIAGTKVTDDGALALKCRLADDGHCARTDQFATVLGTAEGTWTEWCVRIRNNGNPSRIVMWAFTNYAQTEWVEASFSRPTGGNTYAVQCDPVFIPIPMQTIRVYLTPEQGTTYVRWGSIT